MSLANGLWSFSEYRELNCNLFFEAWLENQTDLHGHLRRWRTLPTWRKKLLRMPGASTGDPTHDKGVAERAWRQRRIRTRGTPWTCLSIYPKTRVCLSYYFMTFTNSSDINGGFVFWMREAGSFRYCVCGGGETSKGAISSFWCACGMGSWCAGGEGEKWIA